MKHIIFMIAAPMFLLGCSNAIAENQVKPTDPMVGAATMPNTPAPEMEDGIETIIVGKHSLTVGTDYVEISRIGAGMPDRTDETIRIENASVRLYEESGTDITGEGNPDVIVFSSTGGAHCCYTFHVYDMGEYPRKVMEAFTKDCGGEFKDLEGDGVFEFITCDASFNYFTRQCCYACSPFPRVVYRYTPESGYRVATMDYAYLFQGDIAAAREKLRVWREGSEGFAATHAYRDLAQCELLPLALDYIYSGQPQMAWEMIDEYYRFSDVEEFKGKIRERLERSELYGATE